MFTPWGMADYKKSHMRGVTTVGTPSHGGVMVANGTAKKILSPAAIKRGRPYGAYLAYEEDCDAVIVYLELAEQGIISESDFKNGKEGLIRSLSMWHADYLLERGMEPDEDGYKFYIRNKTEDAMRKAKHPDLVTTAWGDWHTGIPSVCEVATADGKHHLVKGYEKRDSSVANLLSNLEVIHVEGFECSCTNSQIPYTKK